MRLQSLEIRGITRFAETVAVNFATLPGGLVALVGANGEGKTTLMESIAAALYRQMPSRDGKLPDHCQGKDAFIQLTFDHGGSRYRSHLKIDAVRGTQEAYLYNHDGTTPLTSGKLAEFDAKVSELFAPQPLFLASVFAAQTKKGNFLELSKADRKDLMIRMLGLEHLQRISEAAADRAKGIETTIAVAQAKVTDLETKLKELPELRDTLAADVAYLADLRKELDAAKERLQSLVEQEAALKAKADQGDALRRALVEARREVEDIEAKISDLEQRKANNLKVMAHADEIRGAVAEAERLTDELAKTRQAIADLETQREKQVALQEQASCLFEEANHVDSERARLVREADMERNRKVEALDAERLVTQRALSAKRQELSGLEAKLQGVYLQRKGLMTQTTILTEIPCGDSYPTCPLIKNAVEAKGELPAVESQIETLKAEITAAQEAIEDLTAKEHEQLGVRNRACVAEPPAGLDELVRKSDELRTQANQMKPSSEAVETCKVSLKAFQQEISANEAKLANAKKMADFLPRLEEAESRVKELEGDIAQLRTDLGTKTEKRRDLADSLAALPTPDAIAAVSASKAQAQAAVTESEQGIQRIETRIASLRTRITDMEALEPEMATQRAELDAKNQDLAEWRHLQRAFGKDGIQALEIDAAGPEVSTLINELLCSCFGPRFTLSFETTRAKADGKGDREVFDIRIIDNERGREGRIETLSGGEKVILNEAISLALAIYNCRKSGKAFETLFRDETAGALDPENAMRYRQMLQRALELGGFHQLIFICHSQELWETADARVFVAGGKVEVA